METINIFSIPVFKTKIIPTDEQYNKMDKLLTDLFDQASENTWGLETGKSTGEFGVNLHDHAELDWLVKAAHLEACHAWVRLNYAQGAQISVPSVWANLHRPGQVTGEHSHCGGSDKVHLASAYYFKKPEGSGDIEFRDPLELIHSLTPRHMYTDIFGENKHHINIPAEQFDLLIFPAWLKHRTQINKSDGDRVAVSMNFIGNWNQYTYN